MRGKRIIATLLTLILTLSFSKEVLAATDLEAIKENIKKVTQLEKTNEEVVKDENENNKESKSTKDELGIGSKLSVKDIVKYSNYDIYMGWEPIEGATYEVAINDKILETKDNFVINKQLPNKDYTYKVRYKYNDEYSLWSDTKQFNWIDESAKLRAAMPQEKSTTDLAMSAEVYGSNQGVEKWYPTVIDSNGVHSIVLDSRIQMIKLKLVNPPADVSIEYKAYIIEDRKWTEYKKANEEVGVKGKTIGAISVKSTGISNSYVCYSTLDMNNIQSQWFNNENTFKNLENVNGIKGIKLKIDKNYKVLDKSETIQSGQTREFKGFIEIPEGVELTLESGSNVNFSNDVSKEVGFVVKGKLNIKGTDSSPVNINSTNNDLNIDIQETGTMAATALNIKSKEISNNAVVNVYGLLTGEKLNITNLATSKLSTGINIDSNVYGKSESLIKINNGIITNFNKGININTKQDGVDLNGNIFDNNEAGIYIKNNDTTGNDRVVNVKTNKFKNNVSAITVEQVSNMKDKLYKKVIIDGNIINENIVNESMFYGIRLNVDGLNNITINNNKIYNINPKITEVTKEIGGPIILQNSAINTGLSEDSIDLFKNIRGNTISNNKYNNIILDKISIAESSRISISSKNITPLIFDTLKIYSKAVLNIDPGTRINTIGGEVSKIISAGILNFNGSTTNKIELAYTSGSNGITIDVLDNGTIFASDLIVDNYKINSHLINLSKNSQSIIKNSTFKNIKSSTNNLYILYMRNSRSIVNNTILTGSDSLDERKINGIYVAGDNTVIDNVIVNNVSREAVSIEAGDVLIQNIQINSAAWGITIDSKGMPTFINGGIITGVTYGILTFNDDGKDLINVDGLNIVAARMAIYIQRGGILNVTRSELVANGDFVSQYGESGTGIYVGAYVSDVLINLNYTKIKSYTAREAYLDPYCVLVGDASSGVFNAKYCAFIQPNDPSDNIFIGSRGTWDFSGGSTSPYDGLGYNAFGVEKPGEAIGWNPSWLGVAISTEEVIWADKIPNRLMYDPTINKSDSINLQNIIDKVVNDFQYQIRKLFGNEGVTSSTGNYSFNRTDLSLDSAGIDFEFTRTYNSLNKESGMLGKGWSLSYETSLKKEEKTLKDKDDKDINVEVVTITLPNGSVESYLKDTADNNKYKALDTRNKLKLEGEKFTLTDKSGFSYIYNKDGKIEKQIDKYGNEINFTYDGTKLKTISDSVGRTYEFDYSVSKEIILREKVNGSETRKVTYKLDDKKQLQSVIDVNGKTVETYSYNGTEVAEKAQGLLKSISSENKIEVVYNDKGKVDNFTNEFGNKSTYTYSDTEKKTVIKDSKEFTRTDSYDRNGLVYYSAYSDGTYERKVYNYNLKETYKVLSTNPDTKLMLELLEVRDREGRTVKYEYDEFGNVNKQTNPDGGVQSITYDEFGNITESVNEVGVKKTFTYENKILKEEKLLTGKDSTGKEQYSIITYVPNKTNKIKGLIDKKVNPDNSEVSYTYDAYGYLNTETDEEGNKKVTIHNSQGLKEAEYIKGTATDLISKVITYSYEKDGKLKGITANEGVNTLLQDETKLPSNLKALAATSIKYDDYGRILSEIDFQNNTKSYLYNPGTELISTFTNEKGKKVTYTYDLYGNRETSTDSNNRVDIVRHDNLGRITDVLYKESKDGPEIPLEKNEYYNGNGTTKILKNKYIDENKYVLEVIETDWRGNQVSIKDGNGNIKTDTYDKSGKLLSETKADGGSKILKYNAAGLVEYQYERKYNDLYEVKKNVYNNRGQVITEKTGVDFVNLDAEAKKWINKNRIYYKNGLVKEENFDKDYKEVDKSQKYIKYTYTKEGNKKSEAATTSANNEIQKTWEYKYSGLPQGVAYSVTENLPVDKKDIGTSINDEGGTSTVSIVREYNFNAKPVSEKVNRDGALGRNVTYKYDEFNNVVEEKLFEGSQLKETKTKEYNQDNKIAWEINEKGLKTNYRYDSRLNLTIKDNELETYLYGYDRLGRVQWEASDLDYQVALQDAGLSHNKIQGQEGYKYLFDFNNDNINDVFDMMRISSYREVLNKTHFYYDDANNLIAKEKEYADWDSDTIKKEFIAGFKYDAEGRVVKEVDGEAIKNSTGNSISDIVANAYGVEKSYDYQGEVTSVKKPETPAVIYSYDNTIKPENIGRVKVDTLEKGKIETTYDIYGNKLKVETKDKNGTNIVTEENTYDYLGNILTQKDGKNNVYTYTYNNLGKVRTKTLPGDASIAANTISYRYNTYGEELFSKDSTGKVIITDRDYKGRITKENLRTVDNKISITKTNSYELNSNGNTIVTSVDGNGNEKVKNYDRLDRLIKEQAFIQEVSGVREVTNTKEYTTDELVAKTTDNFGNSTTYRYDVYGKLLEKRDADNNIIERLDYYLNGNQKTSKDALGNTKTFIYDKNNRLIQTIDAEGKVWTQGYDSQDNINKKIDPIGNETIYNYDLRNRLLSVITGGDSSSTTSYVYDNNDNLIRITDGEGKVKENNYNARNIISLTSDVTNPKAAEASWVRYTESYNYYPNGELQQNVDKEGQVTKYTVDGIGRETELRTYRNIDDSKAITDKSIDKVITSYDNNNNVLSVEKQKNGVLVDKTVRTYDALNRVKTKEVTGKDASDVKISKFTYDNIDGVDYGYNYETTEIEGTVSKMVHDKVGRVVQSIQGNDVTTFDYYPNGNKKSMIYSSGITEEYSYNKNNMLTSLVNTKGSETLSQYTYQYNNAGKISSKIDNKGTTSYTYDSLNRLKTVTEPSKTTSYTYDKSGNRKQETINQNGKTYSKTYNYQDGLNLLNSVETKEGTTIIGTRSYSYDKNGNMISERISAKSVILPQGANLSINEILENPNKIEENISKATDNEVVARAVKELTMGQIRNTLEATETNIKYEYDIFNDMTKATDLNTNKTLVENKYNAEGLRVSKESDGEKTGYIYEGQNPIVELNLNATGKATVKASNEYVGDTVISKTIGNQKYNYLYNGHGDVVNLISKTGEIKNTYYYDVFGVVGESIENVDNNFKYSKYEYDKQTGKYYLKNRMYDPNTARFMQEDTYRGKTNDPLSLNLYTYCVNEPLTYYDPDGHSPISLFNILRYGLTFLDKNLLSGKGSSTVSSWYESSKISTNNFFTYANSYWTDLGNSIDKSNTAWLVKGIGHFFVGFEKSALSFVSGNFGLATLTIDSSINILNAKSLTEKAEISLNYWKTIGIGLVGTVENLEKNLESLEKFHVVSMLINGKPEFEDFENVGSLTFDTASVVVGGELAPSSIASKFKLGLDDFKKGSGFFNGTGKSKGNIKLNKWVGNPKMWTVDPATQAADIEAGVLKNGSYIKNPTAQNINDMIKDGYNYVGSKKINGQYMYAVDSEGKVIIGNRAGQRMPHPTLIGGENPQVQAAGIVEIRGGKIYMVDNASGHFKPGAGSLEAAENAFSKLPSNVFSKDFQGYVQYK